MTTTIDTDTLTPGQCLGHLLFLLGSTLSDSDYSPETKSAIVSGGNAIVSALCRKVPDISPDEIRATFAEMCIATGAVEDPDAPGLQAFLQSCGATK